MIKEDFMRRFLESVFLVATLAACATAEKTELPRVTTAWTEIGPGGQLLARVVANGACPSLEVDGLSVPTAPRAALSTEFPIPVCEAKIRGGASSIRVEGQTLPSWKPGGVRRVLFIGDTGCKIKKGKDGSTKFQACNDPEKWPFASIARAAAAWKPDIVIHVGDYHYREADCPRGEAACAGSIAGDRWESWKQDFFDPALPLLAAAPWIFVRGNHENCDRGGRGWFLFLDPRSGPEKCAEATPTYDAAFAGHRIFVVDSSDQANIAPSLATISPSTPGERTWIVLHRPFLTPAADDEAVDEVGLPKNLSHPGAVSAVFSGHRHILSLNQFGGTRPPELITGNGGDSLEPLDKLREAGTTSTQFRDFGFLTLERQDEGNSWRMQEHDRNGLVVVDCRLTEKSGAQTDLRCSEGVQSSGRSDY
jgi:hypothetical protein